MNEVTVKVRVHLVTDGDLQEFDEAAIAAWIAEGNTVLLREKRDLNGAICIGDVEIVDELFSAVQRLCFEGAAALLVDGGSVEYRYFSTPEDARLSVKSDAVVLSCNTSESTFPRLPLIRALYACGVRWLAVLDKIGRTPEADHLRPFAATARAALATVGLV